MRITAALPGVVGVRLCDKAVAGEGADPVGHGELAKDLEALLAEQEALRGRVDKRVELDLYYSRLTG